MTRIAQSRQRDRDGVGLPVRDRRSAPIAASRRGRSSFLTTQSICNTHAVCVIIERRSQEMESNRPVPAKNNLNETIGRRLSFPEGTTLSPAAQCTSSRTQTRSFSDMCWCLNLLLLKVDTECSLAPLLC